MRDPLPRVQRGLAAALCDRRTQLSAAAFVLTALACYLYVLVGNINNYDNIVCTPEGYGTGLRSGRWMLTLLGDTVGHAMGNFNLPLFNGLLGLAFLGLACQFLWRALHLQKPWQCAVLTAITAAWPAAASAMLFSFTVHYYLFAVLLAAVAVWMADRSGWGWFVGAVALLFLITLFGNMISWSMGVNSTAAYAAENGDMPAIFAKRWAKNDMPIGSALTSGIVASVVCILGIIIELLSPDSSLFWSFFALNLVMLLLSYAPVFPAFLRLREIDPDSERPFRVPGGHGMLRVLAYVPMALILISIFFTAVPLSFDTDTLSYYLPITIGSILSIVIGEILIAARARRHHS